MPIVEPYELPNSLSAKRIYVQPLPPDDMLCLSSDLYSSSSFPVVRMDWVIFQ